jgi:hypothetical protein
MIPFASSLAVIITQEYVYPVDAYVINKQLILSCLLAMSTGLALCIPFIGRIINDIRVYYQPLKAEAHV